MLAREGAGGKGVGIDPRTTARNAIQSVGVAGRDDRITEKCLPLQKKA